MCLEAHFWKRLALDSGDWVKRFTFTSVNKHHPIHWGPEWNMKSDRGVNCLFSLSFSVSLSSWAGTSIFCPLTLKFMVLRPSDSGTPTSDLPKISALLRPLPPCPSSQVCGWGLNYTTNFPGPPTCKQQILGLLGLHKTVNELF